MSGSCGDAGAAAVVSLSAHFVVDVGVLDRAGCRRELAVSAGVRRWLDGRDVQLAGRLSALADADPAAPPVEHDVAGTTRTDPSVAQRLTKRAATARRVEPLAGPVAEGAVSGEHLDVVGQALARFDEARRAQFCERFGDQIAELARSCTAGELRAQLVRWAQGFETADESVDRLARQRRQNRFRTWTDRDSGMLQLRGQFDPETGRLFLGRLHSTVQALFHDKAPADCPDDPGEKQDYLRAAALAHLAGAGDQAAVDDPGGPEHAADQAATNGEAAARSRGAAAAGDPSVAGDGPGGPTHEPANFASRPCPGCGCRPAPTPAPRPVRPEVIVVIDAQTLCYGRHPGTYLDSGVPGLELPIETIRRWAVLATLVPLVADADGVVTQVGDPAQRLQLGRSTRLANRSQRRALRAMYSTCAISGCAVAFEHCQPHHVLWWRHGGRTDLTNLLPLCSRHHHHVHDDGWQLELAADRSLTVTMPDRTTMTTGPPRTERPQ